MSDLSTNRRQFLKSASLGGAVMLTKPSSLLPETIASAGKIKLKEGTVILFQGDSITDAGRKRETKDANNQSALGNGYPMLATAAMLKQYADKKLQIYNRGVSGNKVYQLSDRWDADCLDLKPDVLSILIGVNDYWHTLNGSYKGTVETYHTDYIKLLQRTKDKLPDVQLIIGEPFAILGVKAVDEKWFPQFNEYRSAAKEVAQQFKATFIPYQEVFDKAIKKAPAAYWTGDGVHPSLAGHQLMADAWLSNVKG